MANAPPNLATIQSPPHDDRCDCCLEIAEVIQGPKRRHGGLHLDHDHSTGDFRGWLCSNCNRGIGLLRDEDGVQKALDYLRREYPWQLPHWYFEDRETLSPYPKRLLDMAAQTPVWLRSTGSSYYSGSTQGRALRCCMKIPNSGRGPKRLLVERYLDYDHETGKFRGWLCNSCNRGIGLLCNSADGVQKALKYLQRYSCARPSVKRFDPCQHLEAAQTGGQFR